MILFFKFYCKLDIMQITFATDDLLIKLVKWSQNPALSESSDDIKSKGSQECCKLESAHTGQRVRGKYQNERTRTLSG